MLGEQVCTQFVRTITSQAHLTPLPLHVTPIYWDFDHALRLYPVPDLVVIGDRYQPFAAPVDGADIGQVVCTVGVRLQLKSCSLASRCRAHLRTTSSHSTCIFRQIDGSICPK
jgi:hypothetical protein